MNWVKVNSERGDWVNLAMVVRVVAGESGTVILYLMDGTVARIEDRQEASRVLASVSGTPMQDNLVGAYRKDE